MVQRLLRFKCTKSSQSTSLSTSQIYFFAGNETCQNWDVWQITSLRSTRGSVLKNTTFSLKFKNLQKDLFTIPRLKVAIHLAHHFVHYFQLLIVWTKSGQLIFNWNKELIFYTKDPAESLYVFECVKGFWQFRVCVVLAGFSSLANHKGSADTVLWVKYMRPTYTLWTCTA